MVFLQKFHSAVEWSPIRMVFLQEFHCTLEERRGKKWSASIYVIYNYTIILYHFVLVTCTKVSFFFSFFWGENVCSFCSFFDRTLGSSRGWVRFCGVHNCLPDLFDHILSPCHANSHTPAYWSESVCCLSENISSVLCGRCVCHCDQDQWFCFFRAHARFSGWQWWGWRTGDHACLCSHCPPSWHWPVQWGQSRSQSPGVGHHSSWGSFVW